MNLGAWITNSIINEQSNVQRVIAIYPGRFQPMGQHHKATYDWLAKKFGQKNTFISTSDKTDDKSPFNFREKLEIIKAYGIPESQIIMTKSPYQSLEITDKFDPETTAVVFMYGDKDAGRISYTKKDGSPGYFQPYKENDILQPLSKHGYIVIAPHMQFNIPGYGEMSGTTLRQSLAAATDTKTYKNLLGFNNIDVFNMIHDKLAPGRPLNVVDERKSTRTTPVSESSLQPGWWRDLIREISLEVEEDIAPDILTSFNVQDQLNPVIWEKDSVLKSEVRRKLLQIANDFFKELELPAGTVLDDIVLTGSIANYNWSKYSDIDIHLRLDFSKLNGNMDIVRNYMLSKKTIWNLTHDITIYGYPVELYVENIGDPHVSSGVYSILNNKWINTPTSDKVQIDKSSIIKKVESYEANLPILKKLIDSGKFDKVISIIDQLKTRIKSMRQAGLESGGEYSIENLAFKVLRRSEFMDTLSNMRIKAYDSQMGINESLLLEGGAAGHMAHVFDDTDLTFADLKELVRRSLAGELDLESAVTEKSDGQNIQITYNTGQVGAARNKSTIIDPMSIDDLKLKFAGRGDIENAFIYAMKDLQTAIEKLPIDVRTKIFQNGKRFANVEIIYPATKNVIYYGPAAYLQLHGLDEYDENATKIKSYPELGGTLQKLITKVNADTQEHFKIIPPNIIKMQRDVKFDEKVPYYINKIDALKNRYNLKDIDEVSKYHEAAWVEYIDSQFPGLQPDVKQGLIQRWAYQDKSYRLDRKNIADPNVLEKAIKIDKNDMSRIAKNNIGKFEQIFLELGADVLNNISNFLAVNPAESVQNLRRDIAKAIRDIKSSNDLESLHKLKDQLTRIKQAGGFEKIVPAEGIVFVYKGNTYKYTGVFASINQLLGILRYAR
jgi:hypothetical protein